MTRCLDPIRHPGRIIDAITTLPTARRPLRRLALSARNGIAVADSSGFTLIEILVTMMILSVVMLAMFGLLETSSKTGYSDIARDLSVSDQTVAFETMMNEIRQAYAVDCPSGGCGSNASSNYIDFDERGTYPSQQDLRVSFVCNVAQPGATGLYECVRYQAPATDTSDPVPLASGCSQCTSNVVIKNLVNGPVFTNLATQGTARWVSGTATIQSPLSGDLAPALSRYSSDQELSQTFFMVQLGFGQ